MKILILYHLEGNKDRKTIYEHLYSFKKYSDAECTYINAYYHIPSSILKIRFDLVVYHYTFLGQKWGGTKLFRLFLKIHRKLKRLHGYKVAIPQDEYVYTQDLCSFFKEFGVRAVFTCLPQSEWEKVYPRKLSGLEKYVTVFPGYVDEDSLKQIRRYQKDHDKRALDIGYRARKLPYWLGYHALKKWQLTEQFLKVLPKYKLRYDLSNSYAEVFFGHDWYKFLSSCRVVLGCEGGASLYDPNGKIRKSVEKYVGKHPNADFWEVERECFPDLDGNLKLFSLSPRHFESCMTHTCQALVEGDYSGIFKKGLHYIEIKKDWSNIDEVLRKISDVEYCRRIADNAYRDIIGSGKYTYRSFVNLILESVEDKLPKGHQSHYRLAEFYPILDIRSYYFLVKAYMLFRRLAVISAGKLIVMRRYGKAFFRFYRQWLKKILKAKTIRKEKKKRAHILLRLFKKTLRYCIQNLTKIAISLERRYGPIKMSS